MYYWAAQLFLGYYHDRHNYRHHYDNAKEICYVADHQ